MPLTEGLWFFILQSLRISFMQILHGAADTSAEQTAVNKIEIDTNPETLLHAFSQYFVPFKVALKSNTRMNKALSEAFEGYVNKRLDAANLEIDMRSCYGWIKVSNSDVADLLATTNVDKFLSLSPERLAKYGKSKAS